MKMEELKEKVKHFEHGIINTNNMVEFNWYTKEEIQNFISQLEEKIKEQANLINDLNQIVFKNSNLIIYWDKLNEKAKVPNKRDEDAGFDIYTTEGECVLNPGETKFFKTGLRSAFPKEFWIEIKERGSTGAVGLSVRSGVIDSGYRGAWKIMLTNVNNYPVEFSNSVDKVTYIYGKIFKKKIKKVIYPLSKAIAQAVVIPLPVATCRPWNEAEIESSERGESGWGASGK
jgi:dUTP pyrophosphatase